MIEDVVRAAEGQMKKVVENLKNEFGKLRAGRAHPGLVEHVKVDYYGNETALNHVASIVASDARTLTITPWEKTMIKPIEKAILNSDLGLNPMSDGNVVRIPLPALTEERRKELVKVVRANAEQSKINVRKIRHDANDSLKKQLKAKEISEDDERRTQDAVQKLTDKYVAEIDKLIAAKEADLMAM